MTSLTGVYIRLKIISQRRPAQYVTLGLIRLLQTWSLVFLFTDLEINRSLSAMGHLELWFLNFSAPYPQVSLIALLISIHFHFLVGREKNLSLYV